MLACRQSSRHRRTVTRQPMPRKSTTLGKCALQQRRDTKPAQRLEAATKLLLQAQNRSVTYDIGLHLSKACSAGCNVLVDRLAFARELCVTRSNPEISKFNSRFGIEKSCSVSNFDMQSIIASCLRQMGQKVAPLTRSCNAFDCNVS